MKHFSYEVREDIVWITLDVVSSKVNVLNVSVMDEFEQLLAQLPDLSGVQGAVLCSGKADSFIAGADIAMLSEVATVDDGFLLSQRGQLIYQKMAALPWPLVAAVHGACLGGGFELVLACHACVCSSDDKTQFALPEVQLGLLPGAGGTQRLVDRLGLMQALPYLLTGKSIRAKSAQRLGLVSEVVSAAYLPQAALSCLKAMQKKTRAFKFSWIRWGMEHNRWLANKVLESARRKTRIKTHDLYPATIKIMDVLQVRIEKGREAAFDAESRAFAQLLMSPESKALRHLFALVTANKNSVDLTSEVKPIEHLAVIGAGLMGSGIAYVSAIKAEVDTRIKDVAESKLHEALQYSWQLLRKKVRSGYLSETSAKRSMQSLSVTSAWQGFRHCDLFIEAVFEEVSLKQSVIESIEQVCSKEAIIASNTSSIPIASLAQVSQRPSQVIGLHYFSPVEKMPLVEIVMSEHTSQSTLERCLALVKRQGKHHIVVKDGPGFYTSRILAPYLNEAALMLQEGNSIERVDQALVQFGFPIGPFALLDEVGLDVAGKIMPILQAAFPLRMDTASSLSTLLTHQRLGKKVKKGFYHYSDGAKKSSTRPVDENVYAQLGIELTNRLSTQQIQERCVYQMLLEALHCLQDGIIATPEDGDLGSVMGLGFPPFLGGVFHYMHQIGVEAVYQKLCMLENQYGKRFASPSILQDPSFWLSGSDTKAGVEA